LHLELHAVDIVGAAEEIRQLRDRGFDGEVVAADHARVREGGAGGVGVEKVRVAIGSVADAVKTRRPTGDAGRHGREFRSPVTPL